MLPPKTIRRCQVVYPGEVLELVDGGLLLGNAQLVLELARSCEPHTELVLLHLLLLKVVQRVRAAGVSPHIWEGDLLGCPLLQQKLAILGPEDERREGAVQETLVDVLHQMTYPRLSMRNSTVP